jgi:phosphodiesterase/alkaline phosphatase D-like protein
MKRLNGSSAIMAIFLIIVGCGGGGGSDAPPPGQGNQPPLVTTDPATNITATTASLHTTIHSNGLQTDYIFEWGTDPNLIGASITPGFFISPPNLTYGVQIENLTPSTKYYFRAIAGSTAGVTKGSILSFTTGMPGGAPTVQTLAATSITQSSAMLNASVNPNGLATTGYFEWGTSPTLAGATRTPDQVIGTGTTSIAVNAPISGLTDNTHYYLRVAAVSTAGTTFGSIMNFTTLPPNPPPTVQTLNANPIGVNSATLNGNINPNGSETYAYFRWSTSVNADNTFNNAINTTSQYIGAGTTIVSVSAPLIGLAPATTYYFKMVASRFPGVVFPGALASFTTQPLGGIPPVVQTMTAISVTANSATLNGNINPNGLATTVFFEWGTSATLTGASKTPDQSIGAGTTSISVNASLTGLIASTTYYFRVVATNSAGTNPGNILNFPTPAGTGNLPIIGFPSYQSVTTTSVEFTSVGDSLLTPGVLYIEYADDPSFVRAIKTPEQAFDGRMTPYFFPVSFLFPATHYYFRAVGVNANGTIKNPQDPIYVIGVGTGIIVPWVRTAVAAGYPEATQTYTGGSETSTSALLNSTVISAHEPVDVYFEVDTDFNFANATKFPIPTIPATPSFGTPVTATITGLTPATPYFHRAVATNSMGTSIGLITGFTTLP